jgi:serine/threonine protein kinase
MSGFEALLAGRTLCERYLIEELIGRGGMGAVYRAADERLGRAVAVKVISPAGPAGAESRETLRGRFVREARAAARLHHPNVVTIHDFGTDPALGLDFLVMELLRGEDLGVRLGQGWAPSPERAVALLRGAARGLAAGHRAGLVHRDVKPGNLFLCEDDEDGEEDGGGVRVLDFGIAQVTYDDGDGTVTHFTRLGGAPLSPAYAAPEQLRGEGPVGPAADVYGLGAIAYQLLAGRRPFSDAEVRRIAGGGEVEPPAPVPARDGVPAELAALVSRALSFDPAARPSDAAAFLDSLDAALGLAPARATRRALTVLAPALAADSDGEPTPASPTAFPATDRDGEEWEDGEDEDDAHTALAPLAAVPRPVPADGVSGPRQFCDQCGRRLDDDARFCPRCGLRVPGTAVTAPPAGPPAKARRRTSPVVAAALILVAALGALGSAALSGALPLPREAQEPLPGIPEVGELPEVVVAVPERIHEPVWAVSPVGQDGMCGSFFDACIRVACSVTNTGTAGGTAAVTARLRGDAEHERSYSLHLAAGEGQILTFEFPEVHAGERYDRAFCSARTERIDRRKIPKPDNPAYVEPSSSAEGRETSFPGRGEAR